MLNKYTMYCIVLIFFHIFVPSNKNIFIKKIKY